MFCSFSHCYMYAQLHGLCYVFQLYHFFCTLVSGLSHWDDDSTFHIATFSSVQNDTNGMNHIHNI